VHVALKRRPGHCEQLPAVGPHVGEVFGFFYHCNIILKKLFGSQPEDGFMKKAETCRYDFLIIF
jgi:hypothetical protein